MHLSVSGAVVVLSAVLLLGACEPALAPEPDVTPTPVAAPSPQIQALLQAMHAKGNADPAQVEALQRVGAAMAAGSAGGRAHATAPPALTPSMTRALRELRGAEGDSQKMLTILRSAVEQERKSEPRR